MRVEIRDMNDSDWTRVSQIYEDAIKIGKAINKQKYNIILEYNGRNIIKLLRERKIDLIVSDFILGDMPLKELCDEIRLTYSMIELPIIILSSSKSLLNMRSKGCNINDFLKKPIDEEELESKIQTILSMKNTVKEGLKQELQYFSSQISPHFLYNTLNTIIGISYVDEEKTREALYNLATYFRGKLDIQKEDRLISLEEEIKLAKAYLEIEKLRYGNKLEVNFDIENIETMIPPLTIQPIVENSVKYCIKGENQICKINLSIKNEKEGFIAIVIKDNGKGMTKKQQKHLLEGKGNGLGFKNIMKKITLIKGAKLNLHSELGYGTKVEIIMPIISFDDENYM